MGFSLDEALAVAQKAAQVGAEAIAAGYRDRDLSVRHKGLIDLVTQYDLSSERAIRAMVGEAFPSHGFLAEEEGLKEANPQNPVWVVDPLDGTTNYVHRHPFFAVSVALATPGPNGSLEPAVGVVHAPILRERYWAVRGQGAYGQSLGEVDSPPVPLKVSPTAEMVEALVNTGFPYDAHERVKELVAPFERVL
ncbi:MAG: hypothetical protein LBE01_06495, partial [Deltaproteobacteria bacterium]|nr:hypothetical protein [Deltaproteobacteria bacterium]